LAPIYYIDITKVSSSSWIFVMSSTKKNIDEPFYFLLSSMLGIVVCWVKERDYGKFAPWEDIVAQVKYSIVLFSDPGQLWIILDLFSLSWGETVTNMIANVHCFSFVLKNISKYSKGFQIFFSNFYWKGKVFNFWKITKMTMSWTKMSHSAWC
jgi:hypothetical protein